MPALGGRKCSASVAWAHLSLEEPHQGRCRVRAPRAASVRPGCTKEQRAGALARRGPAQLREQHRIGSDKFRAC